MPTIQDKIIKTAMRKANVTENDYNIEEDSENDLNEGYLELCQAIIDKVGERYFWDYGLFDVNIGQNEYLIKEFEVVGGDNLDINRIDRLLIQKNGEYKVIPYVSSSNLLLADNKITKSCYTTRDESVFIFPTPTAEIINGLKIESIQTPADLKITDDVSTIRFPRQYHKALKYYIMSCIFSEQRQVNDEQYYHNKFLREKKKLVRGLNGRRKRPVQNKSSNLIKYT